MIGAAYQKPLASTVVAVFTAFAPAVELLCVTGGNKSAGAPFSGKPLSAHEAGKFASRAQETPEPPDSYPARPVDPEAAQLAKLTGREAQILALMADRLTNLEISARLGRELGTIEKHVENLYRNLK
ncbi:MAG TPA: helix-turn-helix transcriptional regulator [Chthoniobacterales bacterium]